MSSVPAPQTPRVVFAGPPAHVEPADLSSYPPTNPRPPAAAATRITTTAITSLEAIDVWESHIG